VPIEQLDQLCEVSQRARQPVDLVDNDDVDLSRSQILKQPLQARAVGVPTGEAGIVIFGPNQRPAGMGLTADIGL